MYKNLNECSELELLNLYSNIINELEKRDVVKTRNQPIAGYSRWLIKNKLKLFQVDNPNEKYDLYDDNGKKYLVRCRQINKNKNVSFGVIRNIEEKNFDYLISIDFNSNFYVNKSYKISLDILLKKIKYNDYQNGYVLKTKDLKLLEKGVEDITDTLK